MYEEIHFGKLFLKQLEMVLEYLTFVILTFDPVTLKSVVFLYWMDVWTKFEDGRSRHSRVIDGKHVWYI